MCGCLADPWKAPPVSTWRASQKALSEVVSPAGTTGGYLPGGLRAESEMAGTGTLTLNSGLPALKTISAHLSSLQTGISIQRSLISPFLGFLSYLIQSSVEFDIYNVLGLFNREGNGTHSSTLAWKIPWVEQPGRLQSMGSLKVRHDWATSLWLFTFMYWRRKGNPLQCSCLENPRDWEAWWAAVYGVAQSQTQLKWLSSSSRAVEGISQVALLVKNLPANARDLRIAGAVPGLVRSPGGEHGNPLQHSCLENHMDRGAWRATVHRVSKSRTWLKWLICMHTRAI